MDGREDFRRGLVFRSGPAESLPEEPHLIFHRVADGTDFLFPDSDAVGDRDLAELVAVPDDFELELLGERHSVAMDLDVVEDLPTEHPHPGLAVADRMSEQDSERGVQDLIPYAMHPRHRAGRKRGEAIAAHEIGLPRFDETNEFREGIRMIRELGVEGRDEPPLCSRKPR